MIYRSILYLSYLAFPFLALLIYLNWRHWTVFKSKKGRLILLACLYVLTFTFIYARFLERYIITTHSTTIETGFDSKLILISDTHLGVYKGGDFLERVVKRINQIEDVDAVLIAGDFTYEPHQDLVELFKPLSAIKFPTYAVLGNHDVEKPGPPLRLKLKASLKTLGVELLQNDSAPIPNTSIQVIGLGSHMASEDQVSLISQFKKEEDVIVLTHNPDSTLSYQNDLADLTLTGHTHGGQIRIPWIYPYFIPTQGDFDQGLYPIESGGQLFITSGLGEVGLPLRLGIPPVIDILITK